MYYLIREWEQRGEVVTEVLSKHRVLDIARERRILALGTNPEDELFIVASHCSPEKCDWRATGGKAVK